MDEQRTFVAQSWEHLCNLLFEESWQPSLGRFRSHFAYKGLTNAEYGLTTSLTRLGGDYANVERHVLRNFRKYAQQRDIFSDSLWSWLALGQHHGLPTRLLDWTYSPFVALHFATHSLFDCNGDSVVWCVDFVEAHKLLPSKMRKALEEEGSDVWTLEMLDEEIPTWEALNELGKRGDLLLFFEPPSLDQRIVNQYALFSVLTDPTVGLDEWLAEHPEMTKRIIVPPQLRPEVRDKLDQANINERVLFPGLDGLCAWLKRHYGPAGDCDRRP
jgi:hypothetical protein